MTYLNLCRGFIYEPFEHANPQHHHTVAEALLTGLGEGSISESTTADIKCILIFLHEWD